MVSEAPSTWNFLQVSSIAMDSCAMGQGEACFRTNVLYLLQLSTVGGRLIAQPTAAGAVMQRPQRWSVEYTPPHTRSCLHPQPSPTCTSEVVEDASSCASVGMVLAMAEANSTADLSEATSA